MVVRQAMMSIISVLVKTGDCEPGRTATEVGPSGALDRVESSHLTPCSKAAARHLRIRPRQPHAGSGLSQQRLKCTARAGRASGEVLRDGVGSSTGRQPAGACKSRRIFIGLCICLGAVPVAGRAAPEAVLAAVDAGIAIRDDRNRVLDVATSGMLTGGPLEPREPAWVVLGGQALEISDGTVVF